MKALLTIGILVGAFFLSGWGNAATESLKVMETKNASLSTSTTSENWLEKLTSVFDPSWQEKLKSADLVTTLKAVSGSNR